jgi:kynurenine formamidase
MVEKANIFIDRLEKGCFMEKIVDLSHPIEDGMITYTGLPGPKITDHLSREASRGHYAKGTTFQIGRIEMVANTGTYIDAPFHRYADGKDLSRFDLESVANLDGLVFRADPATRVISPDLFLDQDVSGKAVLVHTGWDQHWSNIDDNTDGTRPAHTILLGADIPIVEHMCNLGSLPESGFRFFAVPPPVKGMGSFPVRAFALLKR